MFVSFILGKCTQTSHRCFTVLPWTIVVMPRGTSLTCRLHPHQPSHLSPSTNPCHQVISFCHQAHRLTHRVLRITRRVLVHNQEVTVLHRNTSQELAQAEWHPVQRGSTRHLRLYGLMISSIYYNSLIESWNYTYCSLFRYSHIYHKLGWFKKCCSADFRWFCMMVPRCPVTLSSNHK